MRPSEADSLVSHDQRLTACSRSGVRVARRAARAEGGAAAAAPLDPAQERLGTVLREARVRRSLSLSDVARETGISASFLSLVENGKSDIAIGRLVRLLSFYEIPLRDVVSNDPTEERAVMRSGEGRLLPSGEEGIRFLLLTSSGKELMMPMLIVFEPGAELAEHGSHDGDEFVYVLDGRLVLDLKDDGRRTLFAGDSAYYDATQPHLFRNASDKEPLRIICVDAPPSLSG
jgi:XRE family transcriptional regulator, regulator of sulfur utilization